MHWSTGISGQGKLFRVVTAVGVGIGNLEWSARAVVNVEAKN